MFKFPISLLASMFLSALRSGLRGENPRKMRNIARQVFDVIVEEFPDFLDE